MNYSDVQGRWFVMGRIPEEPTKGNHKSNHRITTRKPNEAQKTVNQATNKNKTNNNLVGFPSFSPIRHVSYISLRVFVFQAERKSKFTDIYPCSHSPTSPLWAKITESPGLNVGLPLPPLSEMQQTPGLFQGIRFGSVDP